MYNIFNPHLTYNSSMCTLLEWLTFHMHIISVDSLFDSSFCNRYVSKYGNKRFDKIKLTMHFKMLPGKLDKGCDTKYEFQPTETNTDIG